MEKFFSNQFEDLSNDELLVTEGGNPLAILGVACAIAGIVYFAAKDAAYNETIAYHQYSGHVGHVIMKDYRTPTPHGGEARL